MENTSVMTIFNNPNFSAAVSPSKLIAQNNQGSGINFQAGSDLLVSNFSALSISGNKLAGLAADDGSHVSFTQTIPVTGVNTSLMGNNPDMMLSFASRVTMASGPFPVTCPTASVKR